MFEDLRADLRRCGPTRRAWVRELIYNTGMWSVVGYRYRRWVHTSRMPKVLKLPLVFASVVVSYATEIATNIQLPPSSAIGPGLYVPHTGYVVFSSHARMGSNCTVCQGVTVGHAGGGRHGTTACPTIGNRVYLGPGAILIGPIVVGDDALVGAGAVVTRSVPPRAVVVGNPARVISDRGSFDLIEYPGMDSDPERLASLAARAPRNEPSVPQAAP